MSFFTYYFNKISPSNLKSSFRANISIQQVSDRALNNDNFALYKVLELYDGNHLCVKTKLFSTIQVE